MRRWRSPSKSPVPHPRWTVFAIEEERFEALRLGRLLRRLVDVLIGTKAPESVGFDASIRVPQLVLGETWRHFTSVLAAVRRPDDGWSTDLHRYHLDRIMHQRVSAHYWRTGHLAFTLDGFARMARAVLARGGRRFGPPRRVGLFGYPTRDGRQQWSGGHPLTWPELGEIRSELVGALASGSAVDLEEAAETSAQALWELAAFMSDALGEAIPGGRPHERWVLVVVRTEGDGDGPEPPPPYLCDWRREARSAEDVAAWFEAARRGDRQRLEALIGQGFDIDTRDGAGRTAIFSAIAPFGGNPSLVAWLLERGANANVRDADGSSALDFGSAAVTSGLEANMIANLADTFHKHGYRQRRDFIGTWTFTAGRGEVGLLELHERGITSDARWLRLGAEALVVDEAGRLHMHGEHAGLLVHVVVTLGLDGGAHMSWSDGVTHPAELTLTR